MKKSVFILSVFILAGIFIISCNPKNDSPNAWHRSGSTLTYHLNDGSRAYDFIVSDLLLSEEISFSWKMTEPINSTGKVKITNNAMENANKTVNYFADGSSQTMDNETTIWISRKILKTCKAKEVTEIDLDGEIDSLTYKGNEKYKVKVDGKEQELDVLLLEGLNGNKLWVLDDDKYPLLIKMELQFTIELLSVETK